MRATAVCAKWAKEAMQGTRDQRLARYFLSEAQWFAFYYGYLVEPLKRACDALEEEEVRAQCQKFALNR